MKQLPTKKERHEIYKKALYDIENRIGSNYLCNKMKHISGISCNPESFPELFLFHTDGDGGEAFLSNNIKGLPETYGGTEYGNKLRQIVLVICIEETR